MNDEGFQVPPKVIPFPPEPIAEPPFPPQPPPRLPSRSAEVSLLAILHFALGGLDVVTALLLLFGATLFGAVAQAGGLLGRLLLVVGAVSLGLGLLKCIVGVGVLQRWRWGRILAFVLGGLSIAMVLASLSPPNLLAITASSISKDTEERQRL